MHPINIKYGILSRLKTVCLIYRIFLFQLFDKVGFHE